MHCIHAPFWKPRLHAAALAGKALLRAPHHGRLPPAAAARLRREADLAAGAAEQAQHNGAALGGTRLRGACRTAHMPSKVDSRFIVCFTKDHECFRKLHPRAGIQKFVHMRCSAAAERLRDWQPWGGLFTQRSRNGLPPCGRAVTTPRRYPGRGFMLPKCMPSFGRF